MRVSCSPASSGARLSMKTRFRPCLSAALALALACGAALPAAAMSRIKDIVDFENVRENVIVGYGLVVGLAGTRP